MKKILKEKEKLINSCNKLCYDFKIIELLKKSWQILKKKKI